VITGIKYTCGMCGYTVTNHGQKRGHIVNPTVLCTKDGCQMLTELLHDKEAHNDTVVDSIMAPKREASYL